MKKLLWLPILFLMGCSASYYQARDIKKLDALAVQQQPEFKKLANLLDPCFSNTVVRSDTVIKKGNPDTVQLAGATVITHVKDTVVKTITLPGRQVTIPYYTTITDTVSDLRALNAAQSQFKIKSDSLIIVKTQYATVSHAKSIWMWLSIGLMALIGIFIVIKVYTFFSGGAIAKII